MAKVRIKTKTKNFYSFASKYCSHHRPDYFPIYDSYVEKMLVFCKKQDEFCAFNKYELKEYERFIDVIRQFKTFYQLKRCSLREIDLFLWLSGKEFFPTSY